MNPTAVVDVGNTRIKWGRCVAERIAETASLPPGDPQAWEQQISAWKLPPTSSWVLSGVHPGSLARIADWLTQHGYSIRVLRDWLDLGIRVLLDNPECIGIDRLLNAVAARGQSAAPAVMIDAGTAVTVDYLDES